MDDDDGNPSTLAWLWVIETLSGFKQITTSTLQGLIDSAPVGVDDYSEKTRELVAIRCLEKLYTYSNGIGINPDACSNLDSRIQFDFSRSSEDVLQEILRQIPVSNLKMARAELLKWDVYSFIKHKRAGTIKCHLEQLKESILEGTHPHTDCLKERSGLYPQNNSYTVHVNDGKCDDDLKKDDGNSMHEENMGAKENSVSLKEHLLDGNLSPSKRNMVYSADEHLMGHLHGKQICIDECDEFLRNSKRIKHHASAGIGSEKEKPVSQLRKEVSETSTERILISEQVKHKTEKNKRTTVGNGSVVESHNRYTASNWCQSNNEVFHDESHIPFNATLMAQHMCGGENSEQQVESTPANVHETDLQLKDPNGFEQTVATVKAADDTANGCRVEITGDTIVYQGEEINFSMKKHEEQNLGIKCNEGSKLLVSEATNTVPPIVPERCLDMTTTFMPLNTSGAEPCENTVHETTDAVHHVEPIPRNDDDTDKIQHIINESQSIQKEPNAGSLNFSLKPVLVDTVDGCGAELSSDSDGYHNGKNDLAAKKHEFMSSHCMLDRDFSAMTESTEQNLCMKCNEGGQLLACKTTTCPLMVHKNCLGASAQLDAKGNFSCPFCVYSHTISEYLEAKKTATMARKEMAIFISKGIRKHDVKLVHEFHRQEYSLSKKSSSKCEHIHVKNNGDGQLTRCEDNGEVHVGELANVANNVQFERSQQQGPISHAQSSSREKKNVNNGLVEVLREEEISEMSNVKSLTDGRVEEMVMPTDAVDGCDDNKFTCEKANIASDNQSNAGEEVPQEMAKHDTDGTLEPVSAHNSGKEEISENKCEKHIISRYSLRMHKHETQYNPPTSPQSRRKNIPWTAEEEELIREGVQKFGYNNPQIPWKKILAFGSHVFEKDDKCRTPMDLKDKWKNMCKARSKSKWKTSS